MYNYSYKADEISRYYRDFKTQVSLWFLVFFIIYCYYTYEQSFLNLGSIYLPEIIGVNQYDSIHFIYVSCPIRYLHLKKDK